MTLRLAHRPVSFAEACLAPLDVVGTFETFEGERRPVLRLHGLHLVAFDVPRGIQIWTLRCETDRWAFDAENRHGALRTRLRRFATLASPDPLPTRAEDQAAMVGRLLAAAAGPHVPRLLDALEAALLDLLVRHGADRRISGGLAWAVGPTLACRTPKGDTVSIDLSALRLKRRLSAFRIPAESGVRLQAPTVLRPHEGRATTAHERMAERALLLDTLGPDAKILFP
jgi:hypothetical protein